MAVNYKITIIIKLKNKTWIQKIFYSLEEDFSSTFLVDFGWTFFLGGTGNGVGDGIAHFSFFLSPLREQGDGRSEKYCLHHSQIKK